MELKKYPKIRQLGHAENKDIFLNPEDSIYIEEKIDGCLNYSMKVKTDKGSIPIGEIVNKRLKVKVLSLNKDNTTEYKSITCYHKNGKTNNWLRINYCNHGKNRYIDVTPNHWIFTKEGLKQAKDLTTNDYLISQESALTEDQKSILIGSFLGDGSFRNTNNINRCPLYKETHSIKQERYSNFKFKMLKNLMSYKHFFDSRYSKIEKIEKINPKNKYRYDITVKDNSNYYVKGILVHNSNFRFYINHDCKVIIGSRTQQLTSNEGEDTNMNNMFKRCSDYVREKVYANFSNYNLFNLNNYGYIIFGENCIKHTINYDWDKIPPFLGFDVYDTESDKFLNREQCETIFNNLGLEMVPLVKVVKAKDVKEVNDSIVPKSKYALSSSQDTKAEGIVFKNYDSQIYAKYVRDKFKEKNAEVFGGNPKYNKTDDTDNAELVFKYCTNNRIDKMIFKLLDEGKSLEMGLMKYLPKRIIDDIFEEHWQEIYKSNWKIDFRALRKLIPKRCKQVLQQVITNNALK